MAEKTALQGLILKYVFSETLPSLLIFGKSFIILSTFINYLLIVLIKNVIDKVD